MHLLLSVTVLLFLVVRFFLMMLWVTGLLFIFLLFDGAILGAGGMPLRASGKVAIGLRRIHRSIIPKAPKSVRAVSG